MFARVGDLPRRYWRVTAALVAFGVVNFPDALLLLRLNEIGFSVVEVILAYVTYNAVYAVASYPAGLLADRIPRPAVFGIGLVFFAIGYAGLGLTTDAVAAWLLIGVYGVFTGCTDGVGKAWISSLVGSDLQASAQGVFQGASGFAVLAAGLWAGFLWGADGRLPLLISGIVGGVFAVALLRCRSERLPDRHGDLDVVERERRRPDADDRVAALRRALGDAGRSAVRSPTVTVAGWGSLSFRVAGRKPFPASGIGRRSDRGDRSGGRGRARLVVADRGRWRAPS